MLMLVHRRLPMLQFAIAYQGYVLCLLNIVLPVKARSVLKLLYDLMALIRP